MQWAKHKIEVKDLPKFYSDYTKAIQKGENSLENCYCAWKCVNDNIIYLYDIFTFLKYHLTLLMEVETFYFLQPKIGGKHD